MKLIPLTLLTPIRNEEQIISGWNSRTVLLNPSNIESVGFVDEINKVQLLLTSGRCCPVAETLEQVQALFSASS